MLLRIRTLVLLTCLTWVGAVTADEKSDDVEALEKLLQSDVVAGFLPSR